jgi:hypothetical protein
MPKVDEGHTMKLIRYRDAGMNTYTYFWKNSEHRVASPYFDTEREAQEWYGDKLTALDDPKRIEFEEKRNYEWDEWKAIK